MQHLLVILQASQYAQREEAGRLLRTRAGFVLLSATTSTATSKVFNSDPSGDIADHGRRGAHVT